MGPNLPGEGSDAMLIKDGEEGMPILANGLVKTIDVERSKLHEPSGTTKRQNSKGWFPCLAGCTMGFNLVSSSGSFGEEAMPILANGLVKTIDVGRSKLHEACGTTKRHNSKGWFPCLAGCTIGFNLVSSRGSFGEEAMPILANGLVKTIDVGRSKLHEPCGTTK